MMRAALSEKPGAYEADLRAYCRRIGYAGPLTPTLDTLAALVELHPAAIPFEAIDVLLGHGVDLTPAAVDAKLLGGGRGGYCYEQNGLLKRVLEAIGFQVEGLLARVNWMAPREAPPRPATHMALRVTLGDTPWLADVGFGSCVSTSPLRLDSTDPQPTRHETYRFIPVAGEVQLQALILGEWQPVYRLTGVPQLDVDYELANWHTTTHPSSHFRHQLIVTRTTPEARHILSDSQLTVRAPDGSMDRRILTAAEIERELADRFLLQVEPEWRPIIENAASRGGEEA